MTACPVLPFPLARRRDMIHRQAEYALCLKPEKAEQHIQRQLQTQAVAMRRRGIAEGLINRELASMEAANQAADELAKRTTALGKGDYLSLLPEDDQRIIRNARKSWNTPASQVAETRRQENLKAQAGEIDQRLEHWPLDETTRKDLRLRGFDLHMALNQAENQKSMPPLFSDAEIESWKSGGPAIPWKGGPVPLTRSDPRRGGKFRFPVLLPMDDPRPRFPDMPPVQPLDAAPTKVDVTGTVGGELNGKIVIEDGTGLLKIKSDLNQVIKLVGSLLGGGHSNGPGSAGHSSPDAGAASSGQAAP